MSDKLGTIRKAHCPSCGPNRNSKIMGHFQHTQYADDGSGVWLQNTHEIVQCQGCEIVSHSRSEIFSENIQQTGYSPEGEPEWETGEQIFLWPATKKKIIPDVFIRISDDTLGRLIYEVYSAFNNDLRILCAIGLRTMLDRCSELLQIDPAISFSEKLDALVAEEHIRSADKDALEVLVDAGSAAVHRGWMPGLSELVNLMEVMERFILTTIIEQPDLNNLSIPPKPKRGKKIAAPKASELEIENLANPPAIP